MNSAAVRTIAFPVRLALLLAALVLSGCATAPSFPFVVRNPKSQAYSIEYALADADLSRESSAGRNGVRSVSWLDDQRDSQPVQAPRAATLKIEYPHPDAGAGSALATLSIYDDPDAVPELTARSSGPRWWNSLKRLTPLKNSRHLPATPPDEVVTMTISRAQFEMLMSDLNRGTYGDNRAPASDHLADRNALLSLSHNRRTTRSSSVSQPRLDEFMRRVYHDGDVILGDPGFDRAIVSLAPALAAPDPSVN